jgi:hypothetical protein
VQDDNDADTEGYPDSHTGSPSDPMNTSDNSNTHESSTEPPSSNDDDVFAYGWDIDYSDATSEVISKDPD